MRSRTASCPWLEAGTISKRFRLGPAAAHVGRHEADSPTKRTFTLQRLRNGCQSFIDVEIRQCKFMNLTKIVQSVPGMSMRSCRHSEIKMHGMSSSDGNFLNGEFHLDDTPCTVSENAAIDNIAIDSNRYDPIGLGHAVLIEIVARHGSHRRVQSSVLPFTGPAYRH
jgi:hypothetical protein